jgi:hypothetical protein
MDKLAALHITKKGPWASWAWSEPAATNAPVQDEPVEVVLWMNKNPILPARMDFFFPPLLCPKIFPPPTYHLPTPRPFTPSLELQDVERERAWS